MVTTPLTGASEDAIELVMNNPQLYLPLLFTLAAITLAIWNGRRELVSPLITIPWVIHLVLWGALPFLIQPFLSEGLETSDGPLSRNQLAILHSSTLLVLGVAHTGMNRPLIQPITNFFDRFAPAGGNLFVPTLISLGALLLVELRLSEVDGATFAETVSVVATADAGQLAQSGLVGSILWLLVGFNFAVISLGRREQVSTATLCLAWFALLMFCAFSISRGSRSSVFLPAAAGIFAISTLRGAVRRRAIFGVSVVGIVTVAIGAPVAAVMGVVRNAATVDVTAVQDAYNTLLGGSSLGTQVELIATEVNRKFDAIGPGVELLAMEPPGYAGLTPILSATLSPIPRILFPGKPVPTSRDGTAFGIPYRVAAKAFGDPELGQVMPVSASAISLWEFRWLGPLALVLANLLSLVLLNSVLLSRNVYVRAIALSVMGLPICEFFVGHPSALVQNSLRLCLYLAIAATVCLAYEQVARSAQWRRAVRPPVPSAAGGA